MDPGLEVDVALVRETLGPFQGSFQSKGGQGKVDWWREQENDPTFRKISGHMALSWQISDKFWSYLMIWWQYARFSLYWSKKTWQYGSTPLNVISYNLCWDILSESQAAMVSPKHRHLSWAWEWKGAWLDGNDILFQRTEPLLFHPTLLRFSTEEEWCSGIWDLQPQLGWNPSCHQDQKLLIPKVWIFSFSCFQVRIVLIG